MSTDPKPITNGTGRRLTFARRKQASPIIELAKLLSRTFKQPLGLPTPDQAPEMERLILEVEKLSNTDEPTRTGVRRNDGAS